MWKLCRDIVPLVYLLGKQVNQSPEQLACSCFGVFALLGICKCGAVNVVIFVARLAFFQLRAGLYNKRLKPLAAFPQ